MWQKLFNSVTETPASPWYDAFIPGKDIMFHFWGNTNTVQFQVLVEHRLGSNDEWSTTKLLVDKRGEIVARMTQWPQMRVTPLPGHGAAINGGFYRDIPVEVMLDADRDD